MRQRGRVELSTDLLPPRPSGGYTPRCRFLIGLRTTSTGNPLIIRARDLVLSMLVPVSAPAAADRKRVTAELRALRRHYSLKGLVVRNLIEEGRR